MSKVFAEKKEQTEEHITTEFDSYSQKDLDAFKANKKRDIRNLKQHLDFLRPLIRQAGEELFNPYKKEVEQFGRSIARGAAEEFVNEFKTKVSDPLMVEHYRNQEHKHAMYRDLSIGGALGTAAETLFAYKSRGKGKLFQAALITTAFAASAFINDREKQRCTDAASKFRPTGP